MAFSKKQPFPKLATAMTMIIILTVSKALSLPNCRPPKTDEFFGTRTGTMDSPEKAICLTHNEQSYYVCKQKKFDFFKFRSCPWVEVLAFPKSICQSKGKLQTKRIDWERNSVSTINKLFGVKWHHINTKICMTKASKCKNEKGSSGWSKYSNSIQKEFLAHEMVKYKEMECGAGTVGWPDYETSTGKRKLDIMCWSNDECPKWMAVGKKVNGKTICLAVSTREFKKGESRYTNQRIFVACEWLEPENPDSKERASVEKVSNAHTFGHNMLDYNNDTSGYAIDTWYLVGIFFVILGCVGAICGAMCGVICVYWVAKKY